MFLVGKGDTTVRFYEVDEKSVTQGVCQCNSPSTIASAALIPKTACKIMAGEVAKVLLMTSDGSNIIPVSIVVPRRTYIDFHADIFPDTKSDVEASLTSGQWLKGAAFPGFKLTSLDPSKTAKTSVGGDDSGGGSFNVAGAASTNSLTTAVSQLELFTSSQQQQQQQQPAAAASSTTTSSSSSKLFTPKTSSYRFVSGKSLAASRLDDLKFLSVAINGECDAIKANNLFVAFPIQGPGGRIAVWPAKKFGRLPSTKLPAVICGAEMTDFKFNPFVSDQLVTSSDDGKLRFWKIKSSADGLDKDLEEPVKSFTGG